LEPSGAGALESPSRRTLNDPPFPGVPDTASTAEVGYLRNPDRQYWLAAVMSGFAAGCATKVGRTGLPTALVPDGVTVDAMPVEALDVVTAPSAGDGLAVDDVGEVPTLPDEPHAPQAAPADRPTAASRTLRRLSPGVSLC
jgi:hypothetical protein